MEAFGKRKSFRKKIIFFGQGYTAVIDDWKTLQLYFSLFSKVEIPNENMDVQIVREGENEGECNFALEDPPDWVEMIICPYSKDCALALVGKGLWFQ